LRQNFPAGIFAGTLVPNVRYMGRLL